MLDAEVDEETLDRARAEAERDELFARCAAELAIACDDALLSSITAGRIHALWLPPDLPDRIQIATAEPETRSSAMTRSRRRPVAAHRHQLRPEDRVRVRGLAVMAVPRTWLDLARLLSLPDLVAAGDSALRLGVTIEELEAIVRRSRRMRGVRVARAALPLLDARSWSRPESHLRVAISDPDLPRFAVNESVYRDGGRGWLAEPDLSLAEVKIALEYQGSDHAKVKRMRKDISRFVDLRREGWEVLPFGPAEVFGSPWEIAAEVRGLIRDRAPHLLRPRPR